MSQVVPPLLAPLSKQGHTAFCALTQDSPWSPLGPGGPGGPGGPEKKVSAEEKEFGVRARWYLCDHSTQHGAWHAAAAPSALVRGADKQAENRKVG